MKQFEYLITDEMGIHARPAGLLANEVRKYQSKVTIGKDGKSSDASKIVSVMMLDVEHNDVITVTVEGVDEEKAARSLALFFRENL